MPAAIEPGTIVICRTCGREFLHVRGRGHRCSSCLNECQRVYRARDKERWRQYHREWNAKNPDRVKAKRDKHMSDLENREKANERSRAYYEENADRLRASALARGPMASIVAHGITVEQFEEMLVRQNGVCKICGEDNSRFGKRLAIDHDHETGEVRGLLCNSCNGALGLFKDNPELLLRALDYLNQKGGD